MVRGRSNMGAGGLESPYTHKTYKYFPEHHFDFFFIMNDKLKIPI